MRPPTAERDCGYSAGSTQTASPGECAAGAGLEITLEPGRCCNVRGLHRDKQLPGTMLGRVQGPGVVVGRQPRRDVGRQADVVAVPVASAFEDVDEVLGFVGHAGDESNWGGQAGGPAIPPRSRFLTTKVRDFCHRDLVRTWQKMNSTLRGSAFATVRSAFAGVRSDAFLRQLRRDRLRLYVACPDQSHPRLWQAGEMTGLPRRSSPRRAASRRRAKSGGGGTRIRVLPARYRSKP
jgi:hypothetical protein